jgi:hypothetical protein
VKRPGSEEEEEASCDRCSRSGLKKGRERGKHRKEKKRVLTHMQSWRRRKNPKACETLAMEFI